MRSAQAQIDLASGRPLPLAQDGGYVDVHAFMCHFGIIATYPFFFFFVFLMNKSFYSYPLRERF
jgi:hypothetical protein